MRSSVFTKRLFWLNLCCSGSTSALFFGSSVAAQVQPLPIDIPGYQEYWIQQTPTQRVESARRSASLSTPPDTSSDSSPPIEDLSLEDPSLKKEISEIDPPKGSEISAVEPLSPECEALLNPVLNLDPVDAHESQDMPPVDLDLLNECRLKRLLTEGEASLRQKSLAPIESEDPEITGIALPVGAAPVVAAVLPERSVPIAGLAPQLPSSPNPSIPVAEGLPLSTQPSLPVSPQPIALEPTLPPPVALLPISEQPAAPVLGVGGPVEPISIDSETALASNPKPLVPGAFISSESVPSVSVPSASDLTDTIGSQPWIQSDATLDLLTPQVIDPHVREIAARVSPPIQEPVLISQASGSLGVLPTSSLLKTFPLFEGSISTQSSKSSLLEQFPLFEGSLPSGSNSETVSAPAAELLAKFPIFNSPSLPGIVARDPENNFVQPVATLPETKELLEKFPLLTFGQSYFDVLQDPPLKGSQIRQQLSVEVNTERQVPLDPDQLNVTGDILSYVAEEEVGIAEGNARLQLSDGTTVTGDKLLFYRKERRLRSEGSFLMVIPGQQGDGEREIKGQNLDLDIPSRSAQFESSLVIMPGEEAGTKVYIRSEETTALLGDQIFFENATITTSPEAPISHYVKGDRVEVFPDDRLLVYDARVFAGGEQNTVGDISQGTQIGYFPLFVYSLKDHQWVLPGQSEEEGVYVKTSWAYQFDEYNFGGLRIDAIQKKGLGLGFTHDYILPISDSSNYGRAQFYVVTEADQKRLSSRLRLDHFFDFYESTIFNNYGDLRGQFTLDLNNTYRPAGGRNDNADLRLNSSFQTDLSNTTFNMSRTGSQTRGTYTLPVTINHTQRYDGIRWLQSDLRLDYNQRLSSPGAQDASDTRLSLGSQLTPPGWGGTYRVNYRLHSSSNGDKESRKNFELNFTPERITLSRDITFTTNLEITQNQQPDRDTNGLNFFNKYEARSSLRFDDFEPAKWIRVTPGSIDYNQVLYSTPDQESTVSFNPRVAIEPSSWSKMELRYRRVFNGNNSVPFQTVASTANETHRLDGNLSFSTPQNKLPQVPPGYVAFEDDIPGELPIALTFPDDTEEDLQALLEKNTAELKAAVRNLLRLDTSTGFDYVTQKWDLVTANFTWNTSPNLYDVRVQTSYDPNQGEFRPIRLQYSGRSSTTFERGLRSGLDTYEPGFSYGLQAVYDPKEGDLTSYGLDLDATIGTEWQNHWRFRLGLNEEGFRQIEVRRDLRDFEVRLAYNPQAETLRLDGILVAFPSRPVGLTQEQGSLTLSTPLQNTFGSDELLP